MDTGNQSWVLCNSSKSPALLRGCLKPGKEEVMHTHQEVMDTHQPSLVFFGMPWPVQQSVEFVVIDVLT